MALSSFYGQQMRRPLLRLDPTTAMPVSTEHTRIEFRQGAVKELQQAVAAELKPPGKDNTLDDWIEGARALLRLAEKEGGFEVLADLEVDKWLNFAAALAKPEVTKPFVDLWTQWIDEQKTAKPSPSPSIRPPCSRSGR